MPHTSLPPLLTRTTGKSIPVTPLSASRFAAWLKAQDAATTRWAKDAQFEAKPGSLLLVPAHDGSVARVVWGVEDKLSIYSFAALPFRLPAQSAGYFIDANLSARDADAAALGWLLGSYRFDAYKKTKKNASAPASLVWPTHADRETVTATARATYLVRDLVNTPPNDLGPADLAKAAQALAKETRGAQITVINGNDLLKHNYPTIHAVGRGSARPPCLIDLRWRNPGKPKVTLVGKGVVFDTGGLDIKPPSAMALMKKDMGGAAHALALAQMIMAARLPVDLRVLVPAVENSVGSDSFRPSDVITTRSGITVEVGDTDAEGRLILCDALSEACTEKPDLVIDFATLTGAARVALGPDLPALFCNDDALAHHLCETSMRVEDPLWRLPLWAPYADALASKIADTNNIGGQAGAIAAALFMEKFIPQGIRWIHLDTYAWNASSRPGRPEGGEALGLRAIYALIKETYAGTAKTKQAKRKKK